MTHERLNLGSIPLHALTIKNNNNMNLTQAFLAMVNNQKIVDRNNRKYYIDSIKMTESVITDSVFRIVLRYEDYQLSPKYSTIDELHELVRYELDEPINTRQIDNDLGVFTCTAMDRATFYQCWESEKEYRNIELDYPSDEVMYAIVLESLFGDDSLEDNLKYYISKFIDELGF
jgi:hypothetical protein